MEDLNKEDKIIIPTNEYQTSITQSLLETLPEEERERFLNDVTSIPFIKNLISPNRPRAKDLPRDAEGRIIVDLENPHILEDMDYFRPAALFFEKYDCYTLYKPNSNPNSEYRKFWKEELRRCWEGYVRPSDGEWVTGYMYWFLNYSIMKMNIITKGKKKALRVDDKFPLTFEGIYWRTHYLQQAREAGEHAIELAKRGAGKSFFLASIMSHNLIIGEDKEQSTGRTTILCAYQKEYLKEDKDGTLSKFTPDIAWSFEHTPFPHLLSKSSATEMSWIMGYKDENNISRGSRNTVMGVSAKDDSDKLRGKRGWILFEEMGTFSGLLELYNSTRRSVEEGDYTFALLYLVGTANNNESDFSSAKALLYHPKGYNIKEIKNVFDRPKQGKSTFGFFFPAYINRAGYYNKDGVSDVVGALVAIYKARHTARSTDDPKTILRVIAEDPITPAEAIIQVKNAYFPVQALTERKIQIDDNPNFYDDTYIGTLILNSKGEVEFKPTNDIPIREYPVKNDTVGALEIFNMPEKDSNNKVFENRYILGHDPVDNDQADSSSLTSTFVFDLWKDCIVAEYTGRHSFAEENYEMLRLLCIFYNGRCLYESNKKGCYAYFYKKHSLQYLAETPEYLRDKQLIKYSSFGSNAYGVNASGAINSYADSLLKDWFLKPIMETIKDENGELKEIFTSNLFTIKNRALLEEAIAYNPEINVDRIRAMGMVMLYREEFLIKYGNNLNQEAREEADKNDLCNDSFFVDNFDNRHSIWE